MEMIVFMSFINLINSSNFFTETLLLLRSLSIRLRGILFLKQFKFKSIQLQSKVILKLFLRDFGIGKYVFLV